LYKQHFMIKPKNDVVQTTLYDKVNDIGSRSKTKKYDR
jgi:hypothetical protein